MSEKLTPRLEDNEAAKPTHERHKEQTERLKSQHEIAAKADEKQKPSIEKIRESIEKSAHNKDTIAKSTKAEKTDGEIPAYTSSNLRKNAARRMQKRVQRELPKTDRAFSKVIHQPAVEAVSNAAEGTIARPSGLLIGGLFSALSSLVVLYICRHYGYEYNFVIGIASFAGGFALGIVGEGLYALTRRLLRK